MRFGDVSYFSMKNSEKNENTHIKTARLKLNTSENSSKNTQKT